MGSERPPTETIWIASAPIGRPSSGPSVCYSEATAREYEAIGFSISGPFVHQRAGEGEPWTREDREAEAEGNYEDGYAAGRADALAQRAGEGEPDCERCNGSGRESQDDGLMLTEGDCVACGGSGSGRAGEGEAPAAAAIAALSELVYLKRLKTADPATYGGEGDAKERAWESAEAALDALASARRAGEPPTPENLQRAASDDAVVPGDARPDQGAPELNGPSGSPTHRLSQAETERVTALCGAAPLSVVLGVWMAAKEFYGEPPTPDEVERLRAVWELWEALHTVKAMLAPGASLDLAEDVDATWRNLALDARAALDAARPDRDAREADAWQTVGEEIGRAKADAARQPKGER